MKSDVIEELFKKHYNEALLYMLSLSKDCSVAEEIVSEAFFKALETADGEIRSFKSWLFTVCRNLYYNEQRRTRRCEELPEELAGERDALIDEIIRREDYRALYRAIDLLPQTQAEVITLFYFERLSVKEIAGITGKTPDNVKVILCRARESLRKKLEV